MQGDIEQIPEELNRWLAEATKGLIPEAAESVRQEYIAHFLDGMAETEDSTESPQSRAQKIIETLGNPRRVRRELRKTHLTESDAKWFKYLGFKDQSLDDKALSFIILLVPLCFLGVFEDLSDFRETAQLGLYVAVLAIYFYCYSSLKQGVSIGKLYFLQWLFQIGFLILLSSVFLGETGFERKLVMFGIFCLHLKGAFLLRKLSCISKSIPNPPTTFRLKD